MRFSHDRRGQSVVIGTVILFGFLIVALAVYQAQIVPQDNAQVEFEHSQEVENDVGELRDAILRASSTGSAQPQRVRLGTRYPQRTFFVNPPPATGDLRTTDQRQLRFENVDIGEGAHENVDAFWGTDPVFTTRSLRYTPDYNEYREGPTLTYEHSTIAAEFPNDNVLFRTNQTVVRGDQVSVTALSGSVSENGVDARSVDPEAVSQGTRTVPIEVGDDAEIALPTAVGNEAQLEARWNERLPSGVEAVAGSGEIVLEFTEAGEYRLRLSEVSLDGRGATEAAYIVPVGGTDVTVGESVGVEVRDKYNNPVEDVTVFIDGEEFVTGNEGRVFTTFDSAGSFEAAITDPADPLNYERVEFSVSEGGGDGAGDGGGGSGVGQGGDEPWSETDTTRTIATQGGLWTQIGAVNSIVLTDPRLSPIDPDGDAESDVRYFRLAFVVGDPPGGERRYVFVFPTDPDDMEFEFEDGSFRVDGSVPITVFREDGTGAFELMEGEISQNAINDWYVDGTELNLLDPDIYEDPEDVENELTEIRDYLRNNDGQEAFITDMTGRVNMSLELREDENGGDDGDGTATQYPTSGTANAGTLSNFENMQADDGNVAELQGEGGGGQAFDVTTVTDDVPAGDYTLEIQVGDGSSFQGGGDDVTVSDANGEIGSGTISATGLFSINLDSSVEGDITVRYQGRNQNSDLEIQFQRLV